VPANLPTTGLAFSEAGFGLVLLAPPSAAALLIRSSIIGGWDRLEDLWREWENWFVDVAETHTSRPALVFFRSPHWEHSW
jgi:hypothetical protein